jgi:hypothetical protein
MSDENGQHVPMLDSALEHLARGWSVFPVLLTEEGNGKWDKKPLVKWKRLQTERPTEVEVRQWWTMWPDAAIGVALGPASNIVRFDVDGRVPNELMDLLDPTLMFSSPSGGLGFLYQYKLIGDVKTDALWKGGDHEEFRFQSMGCYTVLPPSMGYEWLNNLEIAKLPRRLEGMILDRATERFFAERRRQAERGTPSNVKRSHIVEALDHLSMERCEDRDSWRNVVFALHDGGGEYYDDALSACARSRSGAYNDTWNPDFTIPT